jgi:hypothetical protein
VQAEMPFARLAFTAHRQGQELGNNRVGQVVEIQLGVHFYQGQYGGHLLKA